MSKKQIDHYNKLLDMPVDTTIAKSLSDFQSSPEKFWQLVINDDGFTNEDAILLAKSLKQDNYLCNICINSDQLGDIGAIAIAKALGDSGFLQCVSLGNKDIGNKGAAAIADLLKENKAIQHLHLNCANIGVDGLNAISKVLNTNFTLVTLEIKNEINFDETLINKHIERNKNLMSKFQARIEILAGVYREGLDSEQPMPPDAPIRLKITEKLYRNSLYLQDTLLTNQDYECDHYNQKILNTYPEMFFKLHGVCTLESYKISEFNNHLKGFQGMLMSKVMSFLTAGDVDWKHATQNLSDVEVAGAEYDAT